MRNISYAMPIVLIGASGLILISRGMHNSWGLFLIPLTDHLNVGREIYSIGISLNVLFPYISGSLVPKRFRFGPFINKIFIINKVFSIKCYLERNKKTKTFSHKVTIN